MKEIEALKILEIWKTNIEEFASVDIDLTLDDSNINEQFKRRQQNITAIQDIDTQLKEIALLRKQQWPGFDDDFVKKAEAILTEGRAVCEYSLIKNRQSLDIAANLKKEISLKLAKLRKSKGYLQSGQMSKRHPSIIVDGHA
jgi:hypothetical protein